MLASNLQLFVAIVEQGSLAGAARQVGLSPASVSERLAALEAHYGVILLHRTTRRISLTEEGRRLFEGAPAVLESINSLHSTVKEGAETLAGPIRISAPLDLGRNIVSQYVDAFLIQHSACSVDMRLFDGFTDIVAEGLDLAVRFGEIDDSTLRVRPLCSVRRLLCASPDYLAKFGTPERPHDLEKHNCLIMRFGPDPDCVWHFTNEGQDESVTVTGDRIANDGELIKSWAIKGQGIALKSELDISQNIGAGELVTFLEEFAPQGKPLQIMFPPQRRLPRRVTVFADGLARHIKRAASRI
ncbi:MAG: LysR family transcriptional regulator [Pseudomonadota bacterium]|nr:LysR family transcriptional regulator [Pseudomonadota bacterium]